MIQTLIQQSALLKGPLSRKCLFRRCGRILKKKSKDQRYSRYFVHVELMHKVCVDALRGNCILCIASHMYCTNYLYSRPSPRGQGGRQRGKCVAFLKNNIGSHRAGQMPDIYIYAPVICNHAQAPGKSGDFDFQSSKAPGAKPCQKPTLRGQSVGKTAAVSPAVSCFLYTAKGSLVSSYHGPASVGPSSVFHNAQTASQKPLGRSKPNFRWSLLG